MKYRVKPISPTEYHVQYKGSLWGWVTKAEISYGEGYFEPKQFSTKELAEKYILGCIRWDKAFLRQEKELKEFKKLNPPYEYP